MVSEGSEGAQQGGANTVPALSVCSTADYHLHGAVNEVAAKFLVDTGAAVSLLNKSVWDKISRDGGLQLETGITQKLVGVQGSPLELCGTTQVEMTLSGESFNMVLLVADSITTDVILGRDFLSKNSCTIDVGRNLVHFGERGMTLSLNSGPGDQQVALVSVMLDARLKVPARSEIEVMVKAPKAVTEGSWIVEGCGEKQKALLVARSIVCPGQQEVPIRLMNARDDDVVIKKGTLVAQMEAVEDPPVSTVNAVEEEATSADECKKKVLWEMVSRCDELPDDDREMLYLLLLEYADVFASNPEDLGRTKAITHQIDTGDAHPIRQQVRRIPPYRREEARKLLQDMLNKEVIVPSSSPWSSPWALLIVLVRKRTALFVFVLTIGESIMSQGRMRTLFRAHLICLVGIGRLRWRRKTGRKLPFVSPMNST